MHKTVAKIQQEGKKTDLPEFGVGDTIKLDVLIVEGEKERVQSYTGTVIARKGFGVTETITVRRVSYGQGVERIFPIHSPRIAKMEVVKHGRVRRAKLYYLRKLVGKAARVDEAVAQQV